MKESLYDILGVTPDATAAAITKAYRARARETHPDKSGDDVQFKRVAHAHDVLGNSKKREEYDATGRDEFEVESYVEKHVELVLGLFSQAVDAQSQSNVLDEEQNPFVIVRGELEHMLAEGEAAATEGRKRAARLKQLQKKVSKRRKKLKPFRSIIDGSVEQVERRVAEVEADLEVGRAALAFLSSAKWDDLFVLHREVATTHRLAHDPRYTVTERTATTGGAI